MGLRLTRRIDTAGLTGTDTAAYKPPAAEGVGMSESPEAVRCWLVERDHDQRNLVTLTYATPDGERSFTRQGSLETLQRRGGVTAAIEVDPDDLSPVDDLDLRDRYAQEVERVRERHDPDDAI